jgi:hypothetical protein
MAVLFGDKVNAINQNFTVVGSISATGNLFFGSDSNRLYQSASNTVSLRVGTSADQAFFDFQGVNGVPTIDGPSGGLALATSNAERMRINSSGNVGIGTTSPKEALHVAGEIIINNNNFIGSNLYFDDSTTNWRYVGNGSGSVMKLADSSGPFVIWNAPNNTSGADEVATITERFIINSDGNVGIGITNPQNFGRLAVNGSIYLAGETSPFLNTTVEEANRTQTYIAFGSNGSANDWAYLRQIGSSNNLHLSLDLHDDGSGDSFSIRSIQSAGSPGDGAINTLFTITSLGNAGINTTTPTFRLVAAQNSTDGAWLHGSSSLSYLGLGGYSSASDGAFRLSYERTTGVITFNGGTRDTPTPRMTITNDGNVGIGTTTPDRSLDVSGAIRGRGTFPDYNVFNGGLEVREVNNVGNTQSGINYAPALTFHWGNITSSKIAMGSEGDFRFIAQNNGTLAQSEFYRNIYVNQVIANGRDSNQLLLHNGGNVPTIIHRNDGTNYYILLSNAGTSPSGTWNTLRPLYFDLANGRLLSDNGQNFNGGTAIVGGTGGTLTFDNGGTLIAKNTAGGNETVFWPRWTDNVTYLNFGANGLHIRNNSSATVAFMQNGGNVGIGLNNPNAKLQINTGLGIGTGDSISSVHGARRSIQLSTDTSYGGSFNDHSGYLIYSTMTSGGWGSQTLTIAKATSWGVYDTANPVIRILGLAGNTGGLVGINVNDPLETLHVGGTIRANAKIIVSNGESDFISTTSTQLRLHNGTNTPTVIHHNNGANYHILLTDNGTSPRGDYNALRPIYISCSTGRVFSNNGQTFRGGLLVDGIDCDGGGATLRGWGGLANDGVLIFGNAGNNYISWQSGNYYFVTGGVTRVFIQGSDGRMGVGGVIDPLASLDAGGQIRIRDAQNGTYTNPGHLAIKATDNAPFISFHTTDGTRNGWLQISNVAARFRGPSDSTMYMGVGGDNIVIKSNGRVGINTADPDQTFSVNGNASKGGSNLWLAFSDIRIKKDITTANIDMCYDAVKNLPLKRYTYRDEMTSLGASQDRTKVGWIAQDVQQIFPKAVYINDHTFNTTGLSANDVLIEDCLSLDVDQIYASMYGAIQKLINITEAQAQTISLLENRLTTLEQV